VKFLCLPCDEVMAFAERQLPGDGTLSAVFACPGCGREMAMLANPMETQLVSSMGVQIGGRGVPEQPLEGTRRSMADGRADAFTEPAGSAATAGAATSPGAPGPTWSPEAVERLQRVPSFVRGMVKRIYADYCRERTIATITPEIMDRARTELGLEGM
jgi:hypothetical protein